MNMRRQIGIYLGVAPQSGEHFVGTWNGDVIRTRSIVWVVESSRWDTDFLVRLKGTRSKPIPNGVDRDGRIEKCEDPQAMIEVDPEKHAQQIIDHEDPYHASRLGQTWLYRWMSTLRGH